MTVKPTLVIEDFTALGQISMVAATTILQAMGQSTALLPTAVLSTQTEGFGQPVAIDTRRWLPQVIDHWDRAGLVLDGAVIGYLGKPALANSVVQILDHYHPQIRVVDPVMADEGQMYPGLSSKLPSALRELCKRATVITPNWTELCLLTGKQPREFKADHLPALITQLRAAGISAAVVVTGIVRGDRVSCCLCSADGYQWYDSPRRPGHFYGSGDAFAALLCGYLTQGCPLEMAVKKASQALAVAIGATQPLNNHDRQYGMKMQKLLAYLSREDENCENAANH